MRAAQGGRGAGAATLRFLQQRRTKLSSSAAAESLRAEIATQQQRAVEREVPWFLENMPITYFRQVPARLQSKHLQAITAVASEDLTMPELMLKEGGHFTFLSDAQAGSKTSTVARELAKLPSDAQLRSVRLFSSMDDRLALHIFTTAERNAPRFASATPDEQAAQGRLHSYVTQLLDGAFTNEQAGRVRE